MKYTKRQNEKMIKHCMDTIKTNMDEIKTCNDFDRLNSLISYNKFMLDNIKIIKTKGLGHHSFDIFRSEIKEILK